MCSCVYALVCLCMYVCTCVCACVRECMCECPHISSVVYCNFVVIWCFVGGNI